MGDANDDRGGPGQAIDEEAAQILSALLTTTSADLDDLRRRCFGDQGSVSLEVLEAAREILAQTGRALRGSDEEDLQRLLAARDVLCQRVEPSVADELTQTAHDAPAPERPALPFKGKAAVPISVAAALEPLPEGSLHGTAQVGQLSPLAGKPLPFRKPVAPPERNAPAPLSSTITEVLLDPRLAAPAEPAEPHAQGAHEQAATLVLSDDGPPQAPTAVSADRPVESRAMSLDDYAVLCAEASVFPDRIDGIRLKYGVVGEAAHREVDRYWQEQFVAQPELRAKWEELTAGFVAFLRRDQG